jgi:DNA-binding NtrC family response regulator
MLSASDTVNTLGVLVVDDEADVRELLVEYFKTKNFDVSAAADGRAAQAAIQREPARYGLVLTDLQLPGLDGLGVLRTVKQANPSAYVVIITGYASLDSAIQAVRLGAYDYLTKPFSLGQLDVILRRIADRESLERESRELLHVESGAPTSRAGPSMVEVGDRLARIESLLARIEASLDQRDRASLDRR